MKLQRVWVSAIRRIVSLMGPLTIALSSQVAVSQSVSDLGRMLTADEFNKLIECTIVRNPENARKAAEYIMIRLPQLTPEQAREDPDNTAWYRALDGCFTIKSGAQLPFSFHELIQRWGNHFDTLHEGINDDQVISEAVKCVAKTDKRRAQDYLRNSPNGAFAPIILLVKTNCRDSRALGIINRRSFDAALASALTRE